ncbi:MAG: hypothetical protein ACYDEN_07920 [Acidimicrobiales bacterium]
MVVHRSTRRSRPTALNGIPTTGALRTLLDLASVAPPAEIDHAIDIALARKHVRISQLRQVALPVQTVRRAGVQALRDALARRGFLGAPHPSVLESRTVRLLRAWDIAPVAMEQWVCGAVYRADFTLAPNVLLEVDGYTYHSSPEAKAADSRRRNDLRAAGYTVIEADWVTVIHHPEQLRAHIDAVLGRRRLTA